MNLRALRLCGRIEFYDFTAEGAAYERDVYLAVQLGRADDDLEEIFHHEFSLLLMKRHSFPFKAWTDANPSEFRYLGDLRIFLDTYGWERSQESEPSLYREGLVVQYGRTTALEDANTYAQFVFAQPEYMKLLIETYPVIRAKYLVFKSFYLGLSPEFGPWFEQIG
jgi:hypothetical protein